MSEPSGSLWRSTLLLSAAASPQQLVETAARTAADRVILDLDDTVPPPRKAGAREHAIAALAELERSGLSVCVRINSPDHPHCVRDLIDVVSAPGGGAVRTICLPRPSDAQPVAAVDWILGQLEREHPRARPIALEIQLETPGALLHSAALLGASERIAALTFGHGDFADALRLPFVAPDGGSPLARHRVHVGELALFQLRLAAGAAGVVALDGPHDDTPAFVDRCEYARGFGFHGTWCTTEGQVALANQVFVPGADEIDRARQVLRDTRDGAAAPEGAGYDAPRVNAARRVLGEARQLEQALLGSADDDRAKESA